MLSKAMGGNPHRNHTSGMRVLHLELVCFLEPNTSMLVYSAYREDRSVWYTGILVERNAFAFTSSDSQNGSQAKVQLVSIAHTASKSCTKTAPELECGDCGGMGWGVTWCWRQGSGLCI